MSQTVTPIALDDIGKLATQVSRAQEPPDWLGGWAAQVLAGLHAGTHLAIMTGPYLDRLLDGTKTIESRFSRNRVAPFERVASGDVIFFKQAAGPITAVGLAGIVHHIDLGIVPLHQVADQYGAAIAPAEASFWSDRVGARYATLVTMLDVIRTDPVPVQKRDRRGWVVLNHSLMANQRMIDSRASAIKASRGSSTRLLT
jgi:hypothetical protein